MLNYYHVINFSDKKSKKNWAQRFDDSIQVKMMT